MTRETKGRAEACDDANRGPRQPASQDQSECCERRSLFLSASRYSCPFVGCGPESRFARTGLGAAHAGRRQGVRGIGDFNTGLDRLPGIVLSECFYELRTQAGASREVIDHIWMGRDSQFGGSRFTWSVVTGSVKDNSESYDLGYSDHPFPSAELRTVPVR